MPEYPFHPESRHTMIAAIEVDDGGDVRAFVLPCWIDADARPVPHGRDADGERVADYLRTITGDAGLDTDYTWDGDRLVVREKGSR